MALVPVPIFVVTVILPLFAPAGTLAESFVLEVTKTWVTFALTPPNLTEVTATKPLPAIVTSVPGFPLAGLKLEITGLANGVTLGAAVTTKAMALVPVPALVVTVIGPVAAP